MCPFRSKNVAADRARPTRITGILAGFVALASLDTLAQLAAPSWPAPAVGQEHACVVTPSGAALCWGRNQYGELGDGSTSERLEPVPVTGLGSGVVAVAAGDAHSCALTVAGGVRCWGNNAVGQLGDGTTTDRRTPVNVATLTSGVTAIGAGAGHTCALLATGAVRCWGLNSDGNLGDGSMTNRTTPVSVTGLAGGVARISAGGSHTCAVTTAGGAKCWGANFYGQLGDGTTTRRLTPVDVSGLTTGMANIAAGFQHTCVLTTSGGVRCWGDRQGGALGNGSSISGSQSTSVQVTGLGSGVFAVTAGNARTCAVTTSGSALCWGLDYLGAANSALIFVSTPVAVAGFSGAAGARSISSGSLTCLGSQDGRLRCWGLGYVGHGFRGIYPFPLFVTGFGENVAMRPMLSAGNAHMCALATSDAMSCWGTNDNGQLGDGTLTSRTRPISVGAGRGKIVSGFAHTCALDTNGEIYCWGDNQYGQLGDGTRTDRASPVRIPFPASDIAAGAYHTCAFDQSLPGVFCWGLNSSGQLGNNSTADSLTPTRAFIPLELTDFAELSAGAAHTCAASSAGNVACWGLNNYGQLGMGDMVNRAMPAVVASLAGQVDELSLGGQHSCAVLRTGALRCWGRNDKGQVGDGTTVQRAIPVNVVSLSAGVASVSAGALHTCVVASGGAVQCWGDNASGQLGNGTADPRSIPTLVSGLGAGARGVAAGGAHSCAIASDGGVRCWGSNTGGQVGDGSVAQRLLPQQVIAPSGAGLYDATPENPVTLPVAGIQPFGMVVNSSVTPTTTTVSAQLTFKPEDVGRVASIYVYALAPPSIVRPSAGAMEPSSIAVPAVSRDGAKADPLPCVLAQLTATGQLQQVSASSLQAFVTGVLSGQGASVNVINGVGTVNIAGATFYIGIGTTPATALGNSRSVATIPGPVECRPQAPQSGWWWNPAEPGRGYSIEVSGDRIWSAAFLYDVTGRSTWHVFGGKSSLDGSLFSGQLLSLANGQTLSGDYRSPFASLSESGAVTIAFSSATRGTIVWPGGSVPIVRYDISGSGLVAPPQREQPESGWWWNQAEDGRGFFIEWQDGQAFIAGYMYDDAGKPVWYLSVQPTPNPRIFSGAWWVACCGQTLAGPYQPYRFTTMNHAPLTIQFTSPTTAILSLPGNRSVNLTRYRF